MKFLCLSTVAFLQAMTAQNGVHGLTVPEDFAKLSEFSRGRKDADRAELMRALHSDLEAQDEGPSLEFADEAASKLKGTRYDARHSVATRCAELAARFGGSFDVNACERHAATLGNRVF